MYQINFRVNEIEKEILEKISNHEKISLAELSKRFVLKELSNFRVELALNLLRDGKMGKKSSFGLSGLRYHEFLLECSKRKITERLSEDIITDELQAIRKLDIKSLLKSNYDKIEKPIQ